MFRSYRPIEEGETILVAADLAAGGLDYCAVQFLSREKLDVPLVYHSKAIATQMTTDLHPMLESIHDKTGKQPTVAYERNNGGVFEMERLAGLNRAGKYKIFNMPGTTNQGMEETKKLGWDTNSATRPAMLTQLKEAVDKQLVRIYDKATILEMFSFVVIQTSSAWKAQAEKGAHDDLVMALAIAWQLYRFVPPEENDYVPQITGYRKGFGGVDIPIYGGLA